MSNKISEFDSLKIQIASPKEIRDWSYGEVLNPETINYRTQNFEKDGLFAENIFGPAKDYRCACGKYKHRRFKGVVCEKCGVEVTSSRVRRERMGHIDLACPVAHIWFWRKNPSRIGRLLGKSANQLKKVIYFAAYIITEVNESARKKAVKKIEKEGQNKEGQEKLLKKLSNLQKGDIISELDYRDLAFKFGHVFEASIGAQAVYNLLSQIDLKEKIKELSAQYEEKKDKKVKQALVLAKNLQKNKLRPEWMCLTVLPVVPPELRPMVELEGGRFASSDLNDLYRRVINRNNRLKKLQDLGAPEVICRNEKRMLQEAVDALIDNSARRRQTQVSQGGQRRALRSLADMLKGKQGRFRRNLLGKRVDYSGRSVIVSGPDLKMHQCGLPKNMALELFKPFIVEHLLEDDLAHNVRAANILIDEGGDQVYDFLEEIIKDRYVLLNRAPTLHRLSIQAFQPVLIEGKAIRLHPLVCPAFNADFDGDQMAVHLPLSDEAQKEAKLLMSAQRNILAPANGLPIANPSQDMVLGAYYLTRLQGDKEDISVNECFNDQDKAILAYESGFVNLRQPIKVSSLPAEITSVGQILFNQALPQEIEFVNEVVGKGKLKSLIARMFNFFDSEKVAQFLDKIKQLTFHYATLSGLTFAMKDLQIPQKKKKLVAKSTKKAQNIENYFEQGLLTEEERHQQIVEIWAELKSKLGDEARGEFSQDQALYSMVESGSRGSWSLIDQMVGMKGLVVNPSGEVIELPIKSSFKEGFGVLEYFIASHGTRKGMADTALRTASAGYLTRRLVDVAQNVIIQEKDCGTDEHIYLYQEDCQDIGQSMAERLFGRVAAESVKGIVKAGQVFNQERAGKVGQKGLAKVAVFSPTTCQSGRGLCQKCFGYDLGHNEMVSLGEAVGIVTAQAIGEPGTQLTLRTFHKGGVAGGDITQGLPRVEELFEDRSPKGEAVVTKEDGLVKRVREENGQKIVSIQIDKEGENLVKDYPLPPGHGLWVEEGDKVEAGDQLCEGSLDLEDLYHLKGRSALLRYIVREIQSIYSDEGAMIDEKYIEVIVRKMISRVKVIDEGDTKLVPGQIVSRWEAEGAKKIQPLISGITKVSLDRSSWLSAASFQETSRVLIDASLEGSQDPLRGLKENVIIGRLIPAGTGFKSN